MKPSPISTRFHARAAAVALAASIALVATGCGGATTASAVTVNGHVISQSDLDSELKAIGANTAYVQAVEAGGGPIKGPGGVDTFTLAFADRVLTRQLFLELVHEEAVRRNIKVTDADIAKAGKAEQAQIDSAQPDRTTGQPGQPTKIWEAFPVTYQNLLARRQAEVIDVQNAIGNVSTDPAEIKKFYDANPALFSQNCVSHILVATPDLADKIRAQIVAGGDFATLAKQSSTDPGSKVKGGDLGCAAPGAYVPEFEAAIKALAVGQLSPVVKTQFGYHIIKLTDRKVTPFDPATVQQTMQADGQKKFTQFITDTVGKAKVSVNRRYGTFQATGQNAGIVPPTPPPSSAGAPPAPGSAGTAPTGQGQGAQPPPTQPDSSQSSASPPTSAP